MFLYCDKTIKVDRDSAEVSPRAVPPFALGGVGFGLSPNLDTKLTIYELCLPSERGCPDSAAPMCCGGVCVAMSCGGGFFTPGGAYDSVCDMVKPMTGKYFVNYFQYQEFVGCVCMLNSWFSNNDEICADNYFFLVQVDGQCRSEKWDLYLYGDMTIKVDRDIVTSMGSAGACVAMSCDGGSFTFDGAYNSLWVAMPMKGNTPSFTSCTKTSLGVFACTMTGSAALTIFAPTTTTPSSSS